MRLALAEERVFSHTSKFQRAKLNSKPTSLTTVYSVNSVLGSNQQRWVLGILHQKEDGNYYLEDDKLSVKVSFAELEYVQKDCFFTEGSLILACGLYHGDCFYLTQMKQPPLHARKSFVFKLNE